MGKEMGERFKREGIYVYLWLIHVVVWQKTAKFCKACILQLKKKLKRKGRGIRDQFANICWITEKSKGIPEKYLLH